MTLPSSATGRSRCGPTFPLRPNGEPRPISLTHRNDEPLAPAPHLGRRGYTHRSFSGAHSRSPRPYRLTQIWYIPAVGAFSYQPCYFAPNSAIALTCGNMARRLSLNQDFEGFCFLLTICLRTCGRSAKTSSSAFEPLWLTFMVNQLWLILLKEGWPSSGGSE